MNQLNIKARVAGLLYLLMGVTAAFGLMIIPSKIIVPDDAAATASRILQSEGLFRLAIFSNLICQASFVFLVLALKDLFRGIDRKQSQLMVGLVYVSIPIAFINTINLIAALMVISGNSYLSAFSTEQLNSMMMLFLNLFKQGTYAVEIFWGLWLLPFGLLIYKSGFLPKILGILLIIACVGYLAESMTSVLTPNYRESVSIFTSISGSVGEISVLLWMIVFGAKAGFRSKALVKA